MRVVNITLVVCENTSSVLGGDDARGGGGWNHIRTLFWEGRRRVTLKSLVSALRMLSAALVVIGVLFVVYSGFVGVKSASDDFWRLDANTNVTLPSTFTAPQFRSIDFLRIQFNSYVKPKHNYFRYFESQKLLI